MPPFSQWRYLPIVGPTYAKSCISFVKIRRSRFATPSSNSHQITPHTIGASWLLRIRLELEC